VELKVSVNIQIVPSAESARRDGWVELVVICNNPVCGEKIRTLPNKGNVLRIVSLNLFLNSNLSKLCLPYSC
jgi:hypothetical protein